jgi:hypothetical protein
MLRSIGAVAAGYIVFGGSAALLFQVSGQAPHEAAPVWFKVASIAWGAVFALIAGWLTARIAVRRPATHAAILAGLIALGAIVSLFADPSGSKWSQTSAAVIMAPCAWLGGLRARSAGPSDPAPV